MLLYYISQYVYTYIIQGIRPWHALRDFTSSYCHKYSCWVLTAEKAEHDSLHIPSHIGISKLQRIQLVS